MAYMRPNPKGKVSPAPKPKAKPSPALPSLEEFKQSAAYRSGAMTYKQYLDYFKSRGGM